MPECDTRMPPIGPNPVAGLANSAPQFNTFINGEIAAVQAALGATPNPVRFIRELFNRLGAPVATFSGGTININVSKIEQFGASLPATQQFDPPFQSTKYAHARIYSPVFRTSPGRAISPTIRLGVVYLGLDKLGHFMQQGYEYFDRIVVNGQTVAQAIQYGKGTERGRYGLVTTGVYSLADLEANYQGYLFYRRIYDALLAGRAIPRQNILNFVSSAMSEEHNCNIYGMNIAHATWANLLTGTWSGQFVQGRQVGWAGAIAVSSRIVVRLVNGLIARVQGTIAYRDPVTGTQTGTYSANPQFIMARAPIAGAQGIRLDIRWKVGPNTGLATLGSRVVDATLGVIRTENRLFGTWGFGKSFANGGKWTFRRIR